MAISLSGTKISQSGTDALPTATANGLTVTAENGINTVDGGSNTLEVSGTLTVDASKERLKMAKLITILAGGVLKIIGNKSVNSLSIPTLREGLVVTGTDVAAVQCQGATAGSPSVLYIENAAVSLHASGMTILGAPTDNVANLNASIQTRGDWAYIRKGGTGDRRIRCINGVGAGYFDFQAKVNYCELWMNYNNPPTNLIGFTPVGCDGIEIQPLPSGATTRVNLLNYDDRYIIASFYTNAKLVVYGGAYVRLQNARIGTNIPFMIQSVPTGKKSVLEYSKFFDIKVTDALGAALNGAKIMVKPTGTAPTGVQASGWTSDIPYNLNLITATTGSDGKGSIEFMYCVAYGSSSEASSATAATLLSSKTYAYFCNTTTKGAEAHSGTIRKYGYKPVSVSLNLIGSGNGAISQAIEALPVVATEAVAGAITGVSFSVNNSLVSASATVARTTQEIYDAWIYWISQDAQYNIDASLITISNKSLNITGSITTSATISGGGNATVGIVATGTATTTGSGSYGSLAISDSTANSQVTIVGVTLNATTKLYVSTNGGTSYTQLTSTVYKYNSGTSSVKFKLEKGTLIQTDDYVLASGITNQFTSFTNDVGVLLQATETNLKAVIPSANTIKTEIESTTVLAKKADIKTEVEASTVLAKKTDVPTKAEIKTELETTNVLAKATEVAKVTGLLTSDNSKFTATALSNAPTGSGGTGGGLTAEQIAQLNRIERSQIAFQYATTASLADGATEIPIASTFTDGYFTGHYVVINDGAGSVVQRLITSHINTTGSMMLPPNMRKSVLQVEAIGAVASGSTVMIQVRTATQDGGLTSEQVQTLADILTALSDKTGYELTADERTAIATAVETALLNETDGSAILQAIKDKIGAENISASTIVDAIKESSIGSDISLIKMLNLLGL